MAEFNVKTVTKVGMGGEAQLAFANQS